MRTGSREGGAYRRSEPHGRALLLACVLALASSLAWSSSALAGLRHVEVKFSCTKVVFTFSGFPAGKEDTVTEGVRTSGTILAQQKFTFIGPEGSDTVNIPAPVGTVLLKAESRWNTNGVVGESGRHRERVVCEAGHPAVSVQKKQMIAGSEKEFTGGPLSGKTGQTVDYEILVRNIGNVPLVLSKFTDPGCEGISGGRGETPLAPKEETVYKCSHVLTESGEYKNVASVTAVPEGEGAEAIDEHSNTVVTSVAPKLSYEAMKLQEIAGSNAGYTSASLTGTVGEIVDYEIILKNTGSVAIAFSEFVDVNCDPGTLSHGGGNVVVAPGASTTFTCTRKLSEATTYQNVAQFYFGAVGGAEKTLAATNTVKVKVSQALAPQKTTEPPPKNDAGGTTTGTTTGAPTGKGGVLSTKSSAKKHKRKVRHTTSHRTPRFTG